MVINWQAGFITTDSRQVSSLFLKRCCICGSIETVFKKKENMMQISLLNTNELTANRAALFVLLFYFFAGTFGKNAAA